MERDYKQLVADLKKYNHCYYVENKSMINDLEYDKLMLKLIKMEKDNPELKDPTSPSMQVGEDISGNFKTYKHKKRMLSLANVFDADGLRAFDARVKKTISENIEYVVEYKVDGLSAGLTYSDSKLKIGATRGNAIKGDIVTDNINTIQSLPKIVKDDLIVRGEVYISDSNFIKINNRQKENGLKEYSSSRNLASGSLKLLDSNITKTRKLDILIFNLENWEDFNFNTHSESMEYVASLGFPTVKSFKYNNIENLINDIPKLENLKNKESFGIDGLAIKVNSFKQREMLGEGTKTPKWAIAYKFPPKQKSTKLLDITLEIGRTGLLTPVAIFEPVSIDGSIISKATLNNMSFIQDNDIRINDNLIIQKAGEIIPQIVSSNREEDSPNKIFEIPTHCPKCGNKLSGSIKTQYCTNQSCPEIIKKRIIYFCSKDAMDIKGLGESVISILLNENKIKDIPDLYDLTENDLIDIPRFKSKTISNIINAIANSKKQPAEKVIIGLGINLVGNSITKILASNFDGFDEILKNQNRLTDINGVGKNIANSILDFSDKYPQLVELLREKGLCFNFKKKNKSNLLSQKIYVLTGTLVNMKRKEMQEYIEDLGGKVSSSLSKNTDFLLIGSNAGSKLDKAKKLGVKVITEDEFMKGIKND